VLAQHLPDARPLEADAAHVVVGDLDQLLQTEHARVRRLAELVHRHAAQRAHKVHHRLAVQPVGAGEDSAHAPRFHTPP